MYYHTTKKGVLAFFLILSFSCFAQNNQTIIDGQSLRFGVDLISPTILCPSDTIVPSEPSLCGADLVFPMPVANDNLPGFQVTRTSGFDSGDEFPVGSTVQTYQVADAVGNTATCSFTVTVIDQEPPTIFCPSDIISITESGECTALVVFATNSADQCGTAVVTINSGMMSGSQFPLGVTMQAFQVTDQSGNTSSCGFQITILDTEGPQFDCPADISVEALPGACEAVVTYSVDYTENCDSLTVSMTSGLASGSSFPVGNTGQTFVGTDQFGNTSVCAFNVNVRDVGSPTIYCPNDITADSDPGVCGAAVSFSVFADDSCSGVMVFPISGQPSGSTFNVGLNNQVYVAADQSTNMDTCSFTILVQDVGNPVLSCPSDIMVPTNANSCDAIVSFSVSAQDACDSVVVSLVQGLAAGTTFPLGTTSQSYLATDEAGNFSTCSFDVTVADQQPPSITCPADIAMVSEINMCGSVVSFVVTAADQCAVSSITVMQGLASGSFFPVGRTNQTFVAVDAAGNSAICSFNIDISDEQNPVIVCPANIQVTTDPGLCSATVNFDVSIEDECDSVQLNLLMGLPSGSSFPLGTTIEHYQAQDRAGNTSTCTFQLTVTDGEGPVMSCPQFVQVNSEPGLCSATANFSVAAADQCDAVSTTLITGFPSGSTFDVGTTMQQYTAVDSAGNVSTCTFMVEVVDDESPVIICPSDPIQSNDSSVCGAEVIFEVIATDQCDSVAPFLLQGLPSGALFPIGVTRQVYTATDSSGNRTICSFDVFINDDEAPLINCPEDILSGTDPSICGSLITYSVITTDQCDQVTPVLLQGLASGEIFPVGVSIQEYESVDQAGNRSTCSFSVTVEDTELPVVICPSDITAATDPGICGAVVSYSVSAFDQCVQLQSIMIAGQLSGSLFQLGTTSLTYGAVDDDGNQAYCSFDIMVIDLEAPQITCPDDTVILVNQGVCGAIFTHEDVIASDQCDAVNAVLSEGLSNGTLFPLGTTLQVFSAVDLAGNLSSCSFEVHIDDNEAPLIDCPQDILKASDPGLCGAVITFSVNAADACDSVQAYLVSGLASSSLFPVGTTTQIFEVTDLASNAASCTFSISVQDVEAPELNCPGDIVVENEQGVCSATVTYNVTAIDQCDSVSVIRLMGGSSGSVYAVGSTLHEFEATDLSGNVSTCSFRVVVEDNQPPMLVCPSEVVADSEGGSCGAEVIFNVTGFSECGSVFPNLMQGLPSGSFFSVGTTVQEYRAIDAAGNVASCSFSVVVQDIEAPIIQCPSDVIIVSEPGLCGAPVSFNVSAADQCGIVQFSMLEGQESGSHYDIGTTRQLFEAIDSSGNRSVCDFDIVIEDVDAPMISCPGNLMVDADPNVCGAIVNFSLQEFDQCSIASELFVSGMPSGSLFPIGMTNQVYVATDLSGNSSSCSFEIHVASDLQLSASAVHLSCSDVNSGQASLDLTGGKSPYSFIWSNGATSKDVSSLSAGNYMVTVTDACGTTANASAQINYQVIWSDVIGLVDTGNGVLQKDANTGWNSGAASANQLSAGSDGSLKFELTNRSTNAVRYYMIGLSEGAVNSDQTALEYAWYYRNGELQIKELGITRLIISNSSLGDELSISREGGLIRYYRNGNLVRETPTDDQKELNANLVSLITGSFVEDINLSFCDPVEVAHQIIHSNCSSSDGALNVLTSGGAVPLELQWSNGFDGASIDNLDVGAYHLTITDATGAEAIRTFNVHNKVVWNNVVNAEVNQHTNLLTKTNPTAWNSGASSSNLLASYMDGYMTFRIAETGKRYAMIGLSDQDEDTHFSSIDYAFYLRNGELQIKENGVTKLFLGNYAEEDQLTVEREGSSIHYWVNDLLVRSTATDNSNSLIVDVSLLINKTSIEDVYTSFCNPFEVWGNVTNTNCFNGAGSIDLAVTGDESDYLYAWSNGEVTSDIVGLASGVYNVTVTDSSGASMEETFEVMNHVIWTDLVGIEIDSSNGQLTMSGSNGWGNAGASSLNVLDAGDEGCVSLTYAEGGPRNFYMVGLSDMSPDAHYNSIDYAFYNRNGELWLYSNGLLVLEHDSLTEGDHLRMCRANGVIEYWRNDVLLHSETVDANLSLVADLALLRKSNTMPALYATFCQRNNRRKVAFGSEHIERIANVEVYPVPADQKLWLSFNTLTKGETTIELFDILGRSVLQPKSILTEAGENLNVAFEVNELKAGTYSLRIRQYDAVIIKKILIQH